MSLTTIGIFTDRTDAENTIKDLVDHGVSADNISYVYANADGKLVASNDVKKVADHDGGDVAEHMGEGGVAGAGTGAVIGALAGLAVATGILPGIGTLLAAGPLAVALGLAGGAAVTGAAAGAGVGGIVGALLGIGVSDDKASMYEEKVREGDLLVAVQSETTSYLSVFEKHGADEIGEYTSS